MIYTLDLLDIVAVKTINEFYNFCDFVDGSISGSHNKNKKHNEQLQDTIHQSSLTDFVDREIKKCEKLSYLFVPRATTYPIFLRYTEGMHYAYHNDFYQMFGVKTDYSVSCFLSSPDDYEGGELVLNIGDRELEYKLNPGECVVYPTGTLHKVNEVTSGQRNVMVFWIESCIVDSRVRSIFTEYSNLMLKRSDLVQQSSADFEAIRYQIMREYGQF